MRSKTTKKIFYSLPKWCQKLIFKRTTGNPYTKYDDKYECIFIHIPRCAGNSISQALFGAEIKHRKIRHLEIFDEEKLNNYFKFTFVRNPWDRLVSAYHFLKQGGKNDRDKSWAEKHLSDFDDFCDFVFGLSQQSVASRILSEQHFQSQYKYLEDSKENIKVDFIGKVEKIEEDFQQVKDVLGVKAKLRQRNKSRHKNYVNSYNEKTKKIVQEFYSKDIELFNYKFK